MDYLIINTVDLIIIYVYLFKSSFFYFIYIFRKMKELFFKVWYNCFQ